METTGSHAARSIDRDANPPIASLAARIAINLKVLAGLFAVYAPIVAVLLLHRRPLAKIYLVLGAWAVEGILWYCYGGLLARRRRRGSLSSNWSPDC